MVSATVRHPGATAGVNPNARSCSCVEREAFRGAQHALWAMLWRHFPHPLNPIGSCRGAVENEEAYMRLSLRELEAFPRTGLTGLLTLFHASVASEAAAILEYLTKGAIGYRQGTSDCMAQSAGLP